MKVLITGGAGFIGRWTVRKFINMGHEVVVLDNLSNGSQDNIKEFLANPRFKLVKGDIIDSSIVKECFNNISLCLHL
ncbi:MAG: SDR family NAD(P)-dependent oxidoreductase, partial [Deltaproteobacteria bacterium]